MKDEQQQPDGRRGECCGACARRPRMMGVVVGGKEEKFAKREEERGERGEEGKRGVGEGREGRGNLNLAEAGRAGGVGQLIAGSPAGTPSRVTRF